MINLAILYKCGDIEIMRKRKFSDVVLVFDSYYRDKPNAVALILKRIFMCCSVNLCAMMYIIQMFQLSVNKAVVGICCILASILFSLLFVLVKKRFAIPGILLIVGLVIWRVGEPFWERMSLFGDRILLIMDGRFFSAKFFLKNNLSYIDSKYLAYQSAELFGTIFLVAAFSLITAACLFNKIHPTPMILSWFILWIPALVGEKLYFNLWLIPSIALYIAVIAMSISYSQGLAIGIGTTSYRSVVKNNEMSFLRRTAKQSYTTKVVNRHGYYSKYYSIGVYLFTVFSLLGVTSTVLLHGSDGLDYAKLFDLINSMGSKVQSSKPFESGALSEYFTNPTNSVNLQGSSLGLTSPGQSNQEILCVTNSGSLPVYLRGDIGIDYADGSWTSPIVSDFEGQWAVLSINFRPAELNALYNNLEYSGFSYTSASEYVQQQEVTVNYLCDTNVAFLPAYATDFGYYENDMFDIYGDFVARANNKYETVNTLRFTALVPKYINTDNSNVGNGLFLVNNLNDYVNSLNDYGYRLSSGFDTYFDEICGYEGMNSIYRSYVNDTYLSVPEELVEPLSEYINEHNLNFDINLWNQSERYRVATQVANFLRDNYVYSLIAPIDSKNPIMSFLNDTKSGHCALYASSMTLMLRMMGIPARYCTGFVAQPSDGEPMILRSRNLHAWCEVYLDELGWVTFDPTSAASIGDIDIGDISFSTSLGEISIPQISLDISASIAQSNEKSSESSESSVDSNEKSSSDGETSSGIIPSDDNRVNPLPYILGISGIIAVAGSVVLVIYRYKKLGENAQDALKNFSKSNDADLLLTKIHDVMRIRGLSPGRGELPDKFYLRADKTLGCAIYRNHEVLEAAAFGSSDRSDCRVLARLLENLYNQADRESNVMEKIRLRTNFVKIR